MKQQTLLKNGLVYINHRFEQKDLLLSDGRLYIREAGSALPGVCGDGGPNPESASVSDSDIAVVDARGLKIAPGFIDIHTHGSIGVDVNDATAEDLEKVCRFLAGNGTTSWLCSVLTDTEEKTNWCIDQFLLHRKLEHRGANLLGIHLEGPFLSHEYKGAMPDHLLQTANLPLLRSYQKRAKGNIRYITVAPEVEGVAEAIPQILELGIQVAIGHSGADYETAWRAIRNGAAASTHTFNAMKPLHRHAPEILGAVLESDIYCEAICDGRHLHPGIVRLLLKTKGTDRIVAVSDSIMAAGLPDGNYRLGVNDIIVKDGDARLAHADVRAGSTLTQDVALRNLLSFTGRPLEEILPLLTENPAKLIGVFSQKGSIENGKDADLVLLDDENNVVSAYVGGSACPTDLRFA